MWLPNYSAQQLATLADIARPIGANETPLAYIHDMWMRSGLSAPWYLPGLGGLWAGRWGSDMGDLQARAEAEPDRYLRMLDGMARQGADTGDMPRHPSSELVWFVGRGSGTIDWPSEVYNASRFVAGRSPYYTTTQQIAAPLNLGAYSLELVRRLTRYREDRDAASAAEAAARAEEAVKQSAAAAHNATSANAQAAMADTQNRIAQNPAIRIDDAAREIGETVDAVARAASTTGRLLPIIGGALALLLAVAVYLRVRG